MDIARTGETRLKWSQSTEDMTTLDREDRTGTVAAKSPHLYPHWGTALVLHLCQKPIASKTIITYCSGQSEI